MYLSILRPITECQGGEPHCQEEDIGAPRSPSCPRSDEVLASGRESTLPTSALPAGGLAYCASLFLGELSAIELTTWGPLSEGTIHCESIYSIAWPIGGRLGGKTQCHSGASASSSTKDEFKGDHRRTICPLLWKTSSNFSPGCGCRSGCLFMQVFIACLCTLSGETGLPSCHFATLLLTVSH